VYSIGQANQKGNANARIHPDGERIGINFPHAIEPRTTKKGTLRAKNERVWFKLRIPEKFTKYVELLLKSKQAYSVRIIRRNGRYFADISFEIENSGLRHTPEKVAAVDINPEGLALAIVKRDGNLIAHKFFRDDRLIFASEEKRDAITGELVREVIDYAKEKGAEAIIIENLKIRNHRDFGRKGNRIIYAFIRKKFFDNLLIRCWKMNHPVFTVNPAYTSKVGDIKYRRMYGLSIHEAASLCIGRRFYGYDEKLEEPVTITVGKPRERVPVRFVWASLCGYDHPADPYMEPPGRKGSREKSLDGSGQAVFTGRPAGPSGPPLNDNEGERKGGECGANPQATGYGGEPAPFDEDGGKVAANSLRDMQRYAENYP